MLVSQAELTRAHEVENVVVPTYVWEDVEALI
jgi:hypothetical protein